jgi:hypothetical protein
VPARLLVGLAAFEGRLAERISAGREIEDRHIGRQDELARGYDEFQTWDDFNVALLKTSFSGLEEVEKYERSAPSMFSMNPTWDEEVGYLKSAIHERIQRLVSLQGRLELFDEEVPDTGTDSSRIGVDDRTEIFIVHGHDGLAKQEVARFVEQVASRPPVILHERPNQGRTIIEKFEAESAKVAFAIILLTGDDVGGQAPPALAPRARQNVIFEMGFFVGSIGRHRVAVVYEPGVELPSDIDGLLYTLLDDGGAWKLELGREMSAAGLPVDMNRAL